MVCAGAWRRTGLWKGYRHAELQGGHPSGVGRAGPIADTTRKNTARDASRHVQGLSEPEVSDVLPEAGLQVISGPGKGSHGLHAVALTACVADGLIRRIRLECPGRVPFDRQATANEHFFMAYRPGP
ncbi:hypothetical protein SDC9_204810 [bioreactor metagenome]|uniref:Uncharacterized protein n=1 Tax=bioreactor metagenome TaxID=1076179 RepID=A0A645J0Y3_9ZZZZ